MTRVVMPQMGESLAEGTVVRWLKKPGDRVERDEPLFEISTDKVDTDVPSPAGGVLATILVEEGQTVAVGAPVAVIEDADAKAATGNGEAGAAARRPVSSSGDGEKPEESAGHFKSAHAPQLVSFRRGAAASSESPATPTDSRPAFRSRTGPSETPGRMTTTFSPAVLGSARAGGMSIEALTSLAGSGRGGRITKRDVERFLETRGPYGAKTSGAGASAPTVEMDVPREYMYRPAGDDQVVPMSIVRRKIAHHMTWSARISPHATAFAECDMTRAVDLVARERERFASHVGAPLTYTVLAAEALAQTLREFPSFNASVVGDSIVLKPRVHLGIAVAMTSDGAAEPASARGGDELIVPVVRDADGLSIEGFARAIADLAERARRRGLRPEEVQGGTFTLTNPGMFGGLTGTPLLNQPQVGIIGLGAIVKRAVVLSDDRIAARPMMTIALTFDHRAADGVAAFKFLQRLRSRLEAVEMGTGVV